MLWRAGDGQELLSLDGMAPTFSPDGLALLTSGESELLVWRLPDGALLGQFDAGEPGWQAEFSADSRELRVLAQAGAASSLKVVDAASGQLLRDIVLVEEQEVFGLPMNSTLGPYGTLAVATGYNGRVVRAGDGKTLFTSAENDYTVYQVAAFSDDGELAALLNADGRVYLVGAGDAAGADARSGGHQQRRDQPGWQPAGHRQRQPAHLAADRRRADADAEPEYQWELVGGRVADRRAGLLARWQRAGGRERRRRVGHVLPYRRGLADRVRWRGRQQLAD